jgi:hypothetical protein
MIARLRLVTAGEGFVISAKYFYNSLIYRQLNDIFDSPTLLYSYTIYTPQ